MKSISIHVAQPDYEALKSLAQRTGRPVAELIRNAMARYLQEEEQRGPVWDEVRAHKSGRQLSGWDRGDFFDEAREE